MVGIEVHLLKDVTDEEEAASELEIVSVIEEVCSMDLITRPVVSKTCSNALRH